MNREEFLDYISKNPDILIEAQTREKAAEFLKQFTGGITDCCINYKPYEYGYWIESISFASAVEKFIKDYREAYAFLYCFDLESPNNAFDMTCRIWKKHIVIL